MPGCAVRASALLAGALSLLVPGLDGQGLPERPIGRFGTKALSTGQSCPGGRISVVFVDNHSVFDTSDPALEGRFLWFFKVANALHMDTRRSFIERELLFSEGDCADPLLLQESERLLREHRFIARADLFALAQPDGTRHVVVDTQDEWTTQLDLGLTFERGLQVEVIELTELNFLGRGMTLEMSFSERREQRDFGFRLADPQVFGTRWDAEVSVGRTRVGDEWEETVIYPFVAEVGRSAARHRLGRRESLFAYAAGEADYTHVTLPVNQEIFELTGARRFGRPGRFTVLGAGLSRESQIFPDLPESLGVVRDGDFEERREAPSSIHQVVARQATGRTATRLNLILGLRRLGFTQRTGLDALQGVQDVPTGWRGALTLGKSLDVLGEGDVAPTDDLFTRLDLFAGGVSGPWVAAGGLEVEGRRVFGREPAGRGWRDILARAKAFAYLQPAEGSRHTFFGEASFTGGWESVTPYQLTLGGRSGVRGFGQDDFPGARRLLLTVEDRIHLQWPAPTLLDFGLTLFADAGAIWAGDVPFGTSAGLKGTVGGGLRVGFPAGTRSVMRVDLAFPVNGGGHADGPIFRVILNELLGFSGGLSDEELARSRRATIDTEFRGVSR